MKSYLRQICLLIVVLTVGLPCSSIAQDHAEWIELDSVSWSRHQQGGATRLSDGRYRTEQGQFLVVANGTVAAKGPDYRRYRPPAAAAARAPAATTPRDVAPPEQEPAGLLLPAVQAARAGAAASSTAPSSAVQAAPQRGIEPDEINARAASQGRTSPPRVGTSSPRRAETPAGARTLSVQQMMMRLQPRQAAMIAVPPGGGPAGPGNIQGRPPEPPKYEIADCGTATSPMICCHHEQGDGSSCNLFKILCQNAGGTAQGDGESAACSDW
jgi:hypothetical protein